MLLLTFNHKYMIAMIVILISMGQLGCEKLIQTQGGIMKFIVLEKPQLAAATVLAITKVEVRSQSDPTGVFTLVTDREQIILLDAEEDISAELANLSVSTGTYDQVKLTLSAVSITLADGQTVTTVPDESLVIDLNPGIQVKSRRTSVIALELDVTQGSPGSTLEPVIRAVSAEDGS